MIALALIRSSYFAFPTLKRSNQFISRSCFPQLLVSTSSSLLISAFALLMNVLLQQRSCLQNLLSSSGSSIATFISAAHLCKLLVCAV